MGKTKKEYDKILEFLYLDPLYREFALCAQKFRSKRDQNSYTFNAYLTKMKECWCIISFIDNIERMRYEAKH